MPASAGAAVPCTFGTDDGDEPLRDRRRVDDADRGGARAGTTTSGESGGAMTRNAAAAVGAAAGVDTAVGARAAAAGVAGAAPDAADAEGGAGAAAETEKNAARSSPGAGAGAGARAGAGAAAGTAAAYDGGAPFADGVALAFGRGPLASRYSYSDSTACSASLSSSSTATFSGSVAMTVVMSSMSRGSAFRHCPAISLMVSLLSRSALVSIDTSMAASTCRMLLSIPSCPGNGSDGSGMISSSSRAVDWDATAHKHEQPQAQRTRCTCVPPAAPGGAADAVFLSTSVSGGICTGGVKIGGAVSSI